MAVQVGTGYVDIQGDFSTLNKQIAAAIGPLTSRFGKLGTAGAVGLAGITAGAVGATKALYEIGEAFDDAYDKIRVQTGATGKELAKLEKNFRGVVKSVPADFDSASTAVAGLNQRLDLTGKPLRKISQQVLELSRITGTDVSENVRQVTRLFGDWSIETDKQSKTLDRLFRLSQETGIAVGELAGTLVQFGSPLRTLGLDFDFAAAMVARFEKEGVNVTTLMSGLRLAVANLSDPTDDLSAKLKQLGIDAKEPADAVMQVFEAIENTSSTMKGNTLAFEVFGRRAGSDMAAAVREGRFELDELMETVAHGGDTIRKAGRANMDLAEQWTLLKNNLATELEPTASRVFEEIGKAMGDVVDVVTDKSLTREEQFTKLMDMLGDAVADAAPVIAENAGRLGVKLAEGLLSGFMDSDPLGKLFIGGAVLRLFGGAGALRSAGKAAGSTVGKGFAGGFLAGVILLPELNDIFQNAMEDLDLEPDFGFSFGETLDSVFGQLFGGDDSADEAVDDATSAFDEIRKSAKDFTLALAANGEAGGRELRDLGKEMEDLRGKAKREYGAMVLAQARELREMGAINATTFRKIRQTVGDEMGQAKDDAIKASKSMVGTVNDLTVKHWKNLIRQSDKGQKGVGGNYHKMVYAAVEALEALGLSTNNALKALGVDKIDFQVVKPNMQGGSGGATTVNGEVVGGIQRGGPIDRGKPVGDSVPALLERGEYVLNRKAVDHVGRDVLDRINFGMAKRFQRGGVAGGLAFALGPYDVPPIQYDAAHAGGNEHVHISGTSSDWIVAVGHQLQQMGYLVGEHPAFGGVSAVHGHYGPTDHYHGGAIDVNDSDGSESMADLQEIARLLGGPITGAAAEQIKRVLIEGPDGPYTDMAQAAADKVRKAANRYLAQQGPAMVGTGVSYGGGALSESQFLSLAMQALEMTESDTGFAATSGNAQKLLALAIQESGLNPASQNTWDSNAAAGIPSGGLMQLIGPNFDTYHEPGTAHDIFDPLANIAASINYQKDRYGSLVTFSPYLLGGLVQRLARGGSAGGAFGSPRQAIASWFDDKVGNRSNNLYDGGLYYAELAEPSGSSNWGQALGGLPDGYPLDVQFKGKTATLTRGDVGSGGPGGPEIDIHEVAAKALGFPYSVQKVMVGEKGSLAGGASTSTGSTGGGKGESNFTASKFRGMSRREEIRSLVDILGDKDSDLNKAGRQEALDRLRELRENLRKAEEERHRDRRKRVRLRIEDVASLSPHPSRIREAIQDAELTDELYRDMQTIHGFTDLPDLPSDEELLGLGGGDLLDAYNAAVGGEELEIKAEIAKATQLLTQQLIERQEILAGLSAAESQAAIFGRQERKAQRRVEDLDKAIKDESAKKKPNRSMLRQLQLDRRDAVSKLRAIRAGEREVRGFANTQSGNLTDLQGTDRDSGIIDTRIIAGGFMDQIPPGRFGGAILETQGELAQLARDLRDMTGERITMPSPDLDSDSETVVDRSGYLAEIQSPVFEQFFREAWKSLPRHHDGGIIGGPRGSEQPFVGLGGERVLTEAEQAALSQPPVVNVTLVVEEGAGVDPDRMRVVVDDQIATAVRNHRRGGTVGMRATVGGRPIGG